MIAVEAVEKTYDGRHVLGPLSLDVPTGARVAIVGPSGCGKSTLLRVILGLVRPDAGRVVVAGEPLRDENKLAVRRRIGYVVQDGGLFPHLSALDNVRLMARFLKWSEARISERVAELAELVRLPKAALARHPQDISGGQKQRVALMRALMLEPELLFLDEPLGALDPIVRADLQDDLARIFERLGKSVVLVTHDLAEAAFFGHVLVLLQDGRILQQGSLDDFVARPADPFVTRFVRAHRQFDARPESETRA
jgi:osmoprotectant transport system ATP-binding protein